MGSDALYNEQALLRKAVRFVWAVSHVWTAPRPPYWRGAKEGAGSACRASPADQSAFKRAYRIRGARGSYGQ